MKKGDEAMNYSKILILVRFLNKSADCEEQTTSSGSFEQLHGRRCGGRTSNPGKCERRAATWTGARAVLCRRPAVRSHRGQRRFNRWNAARPAGHAQRDSHGRLRIDRNLLATGICSSIARSFSGRSAKGLSTSSLAIDAGTSSSAILAKRIGALLGRGNTRSIHPNEILIARMR